VVVRRSRTVAAPVDDVWRIVRDPYHLPRWWPRVERVEGVTDEQFTEVLSTDHGRSVRADFRIVESLAPERRVWEQEVAGSPFERIMFSARTEVVLAPHQGGTRVTLVLRQEMRGTARVAGWVVRRGTRKVLDDALRALEAMYGA